MHFATHALKISWKGLLKVYTNPSCEKKLVITSQSECPVQGHLGIKTLCHGMSTINEEADVIIPQQVITAIEEGATYVKVISDDTDVFILLLHFYIEQSLSTTAFLEGRSSNRKVIDTGKTAEKKKRCCTVFVGSSCPQQMWQHAKFVWFREEISLLFAAKIPVAKFGRNKCWYIWCYSRRENVYCCSLWHHQHNRYVRNQVRFLKCFKTYYTSLLYGSYWSDYITRGHAIRTNNIHIIALTMNCHNEKQSARNNLKAFRNPWANDSETIFSSHNESYLCMLTCAGRYVSIS